MSVFGVRLAMFLKSVDKQAIFKNTFSRVGVSEQKSNNKLVKKISNFIIMNRVTLKTNLRCRFPPAFSTTLLRSEPL